MLFVGLDKITLTLSGSRQDLLDRLEREAVRKLSMNENQDHNSFLTSIVNPIGSDTMKPNVFSSQHLKKGLKNMVDESLITLDSSDDEENEECAALQSVVLSETENEFEEVDDTVILMDEMDDSDDEDEEVESTQSSAVSHSNKQKKSRKILTNAVVDVEVDDIVTHTLKKVFGYKEFRMGQRWAVNRCLFAKRSLLVMPTGAGKSLCYMVPAMLLPGTTLLF
jgi:hypothetical protein